ncbi:hypothetical protein [Geodermatophilus sp. SYSU D01176]
MPERRRPSPGCRDPAHARPAVVRRYDGLIHGFFAMGALSPAAQAAVDESCARFGELLRD